MSTEVSAPEPAPSAHESSSQPVERAAAIERQPALLPADLPSECGHSTLTVPVGDASVRYFIADVPSLGELRKQVIGDALLVSSAGHGALLFQDFVRAA